MDTPCRTVDWKAEALRRYNENWYDSVNTEWLIHVHCGWDMTRLPQVGHAPWATRMDCPYLCAAINEMEAVIEADTPVQMPASEAEEIRCRFLGFEKSLRETQVEEPFDDGLTEEDWEKCFV